MFESHAEHLNADLFQEFAYPYLKQIRDRVREKIPSDVPMVPLKYFTFLFIFVYKL